MKMSISAVKSLLTARKRGHHKFPRGKEWEVLFYRQVADCDGGAFKMLVSKSYLRSCRFCHSKSVFYTEKFF